MKVTIKCFFSSGQPQNARGKKTLPLSAPAGLVGACPSHKYRCHSNNTIYIINHNYMLITDHKMIPKNMWIPCNILQSWSFFHPFSEDCFNMRWKQRALSHWGPWGPWGPGSRWAPTKSKLSKPLVTWHGQAWECWRSFWHGEVMKRYDKSRDDLKRCEKMWVVCLKVLRCLWFAVLCWIICSEKVRPKSKGMKKAKGPMNLQNLVSQAEDDKLWRLLWSDRGPRELPPITSGNPPDFPHGGK